MPAGNVADLAIGLQAAKGTASVVSSHRVYLMGGDHVRPARNQADVEETSSGRLRNTSYVQQVRAEGNPQIAARPASLGLFLYGAMGAKAVSGASDPWTHTFTLALTQPYLTFWKMLGGLLFERFADCKITSFNLESTASGILAATVGIVGLSPAFKTAAEVTATPDAVEPFLHMDGKGQFLVETVPVSTIRRASMAFSTGVETAQGDAVTPDSANEGMQTITIETEQVISNFNDWNRFHYGSTSPADNAVPTPVVQELAASGVDFKWSKRTSAGVDATPARSLQITATRVQIMAIEGQNYNTDGTPLSRVVRYKIYQPVGGGSGLTAVLKNGIASYVAS